MYESRIIAQVVRSVEIQNNIIKTLSIPRILEQEISGQLFRL